MAHNSFQKALVQRGDHGAVCRAYYHSVCHKTREILGEYKPALVIMDNFKVQITDAGKQSPR